MNLSERIEDVLKVLDAALDSELDAVIIRHAVYNARCVAKNLKDDVEGMYLVQPDPKPSTLQLLALQRLMTEALECDLAGIGDEEYLPNRALNARIVSLAEKMLGVYKGGMRQLRDACLDEINNRLFEESE